MTTFEILTVIAGLALVIVTTAFYMYNAWNMKHQLNLLRKQTEDYMAVSKDNRRMDAIPVLKLDEDHLFHKVRLQDVDDAEKDRIQSELNGWDIERLGAADIYCSFTDPVKSLLFKDNMNREFDLLLRSPTLPKNVREYRVSKYDFRKEWIFTFTNIGNGCACNISLAIGSYIMPIESFLAKGENESLLVIFQDSDTIDLSLEVLFNDIYGNKYKQDISMKFYLNEGKRIKPNVSMPVLVTQD